jgi:hypothetical protein
MHFLKKKMESHHKESLFDSMTQSLRNPEVTNYICSAQWMRLCSIGCLFNFMSTLTSIWEILSDRQTFVHVAIGLLQTADLDIYVRVCKFHCNIFLC